MAQPQPVGRVATEQFAALLAQMAVNGDHDELVRFVNAYIETEPALLAAAAIGLAETCAHVVRELALLQAARFSRCEVEDGGT